MKCQIHVKRKGKTKCQSKGRLMRSKQFQTRATKADILQLKSDVDKLTSQFMPRLDKLEGRCFDADKKITLSRMISPR